MSRFTSEKIEKFIKNAAIFFAPMVALFLGILQGGGTLEQAMNVAYLWVLNTAIDFIRKFRKVDKDSTR